VRRAKSDWQGLQIYTLGHSTRSLDELVALLRSAGVSTLVDIRTIPRSRHVPQFDRDALPAALRSRRLRYVHLPALGGLRHARPDSPNTGWRNASFRGFADYMLTDDFEAGLAELRSLAAASTVAVMCAEAVPWRCHRSLVADALTVRGALVEHIMGAGRPRPHQLTSFAHVDGVRITYAGDAAEGTRQEGTREEGRRKSGMGKVGSDRGEEGRMMRLATRAPFHLQATVRVLQRRPTSLIDLWVNHRYRRVLPTPDGISVGQGTGGFLRATVRRGPVNTTAGNHSGPDLIPCVRDLRRYLRKLKTFSSGRTVDGRVGG